MAQRTVNRRAPANQEGMKSPCRWNRDTHSRHRDYSPTLGRFIERDPIGFEAGDNNWYRFVANGPTGKVDPSGLCEPGFWSTYFHYLTHPWAMDNDLEYGFYAGAGVAVLAGGAAVAGVATGVGTVGSVGAGVGQLTVAAGTIAAHPSTPSVIGGIAEAAAGIDTPGGLDDLARFGAKRLAREPRGQQPPPKMDSFTGLATHRKSWNRSGDVPENSTPSRNL